MWRRHRRPSRPRPPARRHCQRRSACLRVSFLHPRALSVSVRTRHLRPPSSPCRRRYRPRLRPRLRTLRSNRPSRPKFWRRFPQLPPRSATRPSPMSANPNRRIRCLIRALHGLCCQGHRRSPVTRRIRLLWCRAGRICCIRPTTSMPTSPYTRAVTSNLGRRSVMRCRSCPPGPPRASSKRGRPRSPKRDPSGCCTSPPKSAPRVCNASGLRPLADRRDRSLDGQRRWSVLETWAAPSIPMSSVMTRAPCG